MGELRAPLLGDSPARPSLLGSDALSIRQQRQDDRIRTLCLVVLSVAVLGVGCFYLRDILVRFVLALALRYLLTPLIDILSCHGTSSKWKLPRGVAIVVALIIASGVMTFLGVVIAKSIGSFAAHADVYGKRVERLLENAMNLTAQFDGYVPGVGGANDLQQTVTQLARNHLSISGLILNLLGTAARYIENIIYILLFLAFLLAGSKPRSIQGDGDVHFEAEEQIYIYIRGKVAVALLVALCDAAILASVGLKLWLVFGVLTFWLNFIPNVGMALSVLLPLPLVLLDPAFGAVPICVAFFGPLCVGMVAKDVVEPLLIGHSTSLSPVAVLLAVMIWGSIWGLTGMVLAVPMTAVIRIYLAGLDHPLPRYLALVLSGRSDAGYHSTSPITPV